MRSEGDGDLRQGLAYAGPFFWGLGQTAGTDLYKAALRLIRYEMSIRAFPEDDISPLPWLIID